MSPTTEPTPRIYPAVRIDIVRVIVEYRSIVLRTSVIAALLVAILGTLYLLWGQPVRTTASLAFRPTFEGAAVGKYPNQLPFGPSDITSATVVDQVYDRNKVQDYCPRDAFRGGFFVEERSAALAFLNADYQARLADVRVTPIERTRLQAEYQAKRDALPLGYGLVFLEPSSCKAIPTTLMTKALSDVLATWAQDSDVRRGVMKLNVDVLTPESLNVTTTADTPLIVRADLLRAALRRLAANIGEVEKLPGAKLIRTGANQPTLLELEAKVSDLATAALEPLEISAGQAMGASSAIWADGALASATRDQGLAQGKAQAYLDALREYSGTPTPEAGAKTEARGPATSSPDVQTAAPLIDRTFIDRIVELSAPNMQFRQELTRQLVDASVETVRQEANVAHYRRLTEVLRRPGATGLTQQQVAERLAVISDAGKGLAKQYNDVYDELSRVSLRNNSAMYQISGAPLVEVLRSFRPDDLVVAVAVVFVLTLLLTLAACVIWAQLKKPTAVAE